MSSLLGGDAALVIEAYLDRRFPAQAELGTRRRLGDGRPSVLQEVGERLRGDEDGHGDPKPDNTSDAERPRAREALAVELPVEDEGQQQRARHAHDAPCEPLQAENAVVEHEGDQEIGRAHV